MSIPVSYPDSRFYRISEPYAADLGERVRVLKNGLEVRRVRRQRFVRVRCVCGAERAIELVAWLRRPPRRCRGCLHEDKVQSECRRGHDFGDERNVYVRPSGARCCAICQRARRKRDRGPL